MGFDLTMRAKPESVPEDFPGQLEGHPEWYRMRASPMALMASILWHLGALVTQPAPALPAWPPDGVSTERGEAIEAGADATPAERAALDQWKSSYDAAAATRSATGVPSFKFESNDGWIVVPDECQMIAAALRDCRVDDAFTARVNEMAVAHAVAVQKALASMGYSADPPDPWVISREDLVTWLAEWATWNEAAATVGGYTVT